MKKLLYMVVAVLALSSCNNWFDVAPKEEYIDEDALFSSESAFRNALNGIYTELRSSELFGSNLGLGGIEFMGTLPTVWAYSITSPEKKSTPKPVPIIYEHGLSTRNWV